MNYKVSIIMPVYNAEDHLENTLNTIINQSIGFENIELILVDDSSTDNSKNIIESYSNQYNNIVTYFSKQNHGYPGFGRNIGLKKATSEYIMFIDNDDEYDKDICKKLYETITNENADIVCCGSLITDNISEIKYNTEYKNGIEKKDAIIIENEDILSFEFSTIWTNIYKKSIIKNNKISFPEDTRTDDFNFNIDYFLNSNKLIYLKNYYGYQWNNRDNSLSNKNKIKLINNIINSLIYANNRFKDKNKQQYLVYHVKRNLQIIIVNCSFLKIGKNEFKKILKKIYLLEKELNFDHKLDPFWINTINKLILHEKFTIIIWIFKIMNIVRNQPILIKLSRKIKNLSWFITSSWIKMI